MQRYFSTTPVFSAPPSNVDRETGFIQGVTIAQLGLAKGHGAYIDRTFLLQIVDNASAKSAGIKARFGHPNMCSQALGTYLGRFKNYSYSGDKVKADLFIDETAKSTPNGDLYNYVFDMAEKNPDMFGASIVFSLSDSVIVEESIDNKKVKKEFYRLQDLMATDIVDSPAATDGLFSARLSGVEAFPALATQFLDENPEILDFIFTRPDSVFQFFTSYLNNTHMNLPEKIKENFSAFLSAFTVPQASAADPVPSVDGADNTLNTLFAAVSASYPESFTTTEGLTPLQKAEALTAFFSTVNDQLQSTLQSEQSQRAAFDALNTEHQSLVLSNEATIAELTKASTRIQDLTEQLSARPSIPLNVTDPSLSISTPATRDETGKQILASMPLDIKRKLSNTPKSP